ncbi:hypothetical protein AB0C21_27095 [Spirillospora sp. NPDC049024]
MGVDNPPGGPGKGPETTDKPTPPDTGSTSPHDHPGADGKTPRMDSLRAAGWKFPDRPEAGNGQPADRAPQTNDSTSGPPRDKQQPPGAPPTEAKPEDKKDPETDTGSKPTEKPDDDNADPAQTGNGSPHAEKSGQAKPEDPRQDEGERGNDDREAKTDRSETGETASQGDLDNKDRPQDNASSAGDKTDAPQSPPQPPSRLEHIARTREAQQQHAEELRAKFQDAQPPDNTAQPPDSERGDNAVPLQNENAGGPESGPEAQPPAPEALLGDNGGGDPPSDQSPPSTPEDDGDPRAPETGHAQAPEHEPLPLQDSHKSEDGSSQPPEPLADRTPPAEGQPPDQQNGPQPGSETGQPPEPHVEQVEDNGKEPLGPKEGTSDAPKTGDGITEPPDDGNLGGQKPDDQSVPPPERTGENAETPEPQGDQGDGHGTNAEGDGNESDPKEANEKNPEVRPNPIISEIYTDSQGQVHVEPRYGRQQTDESGSELAPNEPETTEPTGLPTREDLDPVGARGGEPGRGELRGPEDDPENREANDEDTEALARWKQKGRDFIRTSDDVADTTEKLAKDIGKLLKWDRPTGTAVSKPAIEVKPHHESIQAANAAIGILGTGIIVYEVARLGRVGIRKIRVQMTGAERANN